jgi:phosphoglycolate phosphatase-like HAD superfamily hydrolase
MKKFVLFDFDGVIADTFALASALAKRTCAHNTEEVYRSAFEGNIYDTYNKDKPGGESAHGPECEHDIDWWAEYHKGSANAAAFEGIIPAVKQIGESYRLAIISSGSASFIRPFLQHEGIEHLFTDILDVDVHTHKTKKMEIMFEKYSVTAADCVFITDTLGDLREAAHHSMGAIAVSWGFHGRDRLEQGVPFRIVDKPAELADAVNEYFSR